MSESEPSRIHILRVWMGIGLAAQIGLVFWPISNYSTLIYLLYFSPLLLLVSIERKNFVVMIKQSDRPLMLSLIFLFAWVTLSSLWSDSNEGKFELFLKTTKYNLLIILYIFGIAYLSRVSTFTLKSCLYLSLFLVFLVAFTSMYFQYVVMGARLVDRFSVFGISGRTIIINPAVAGIYFGSITSMAGYFLINQISRSNKLIIVALGLIFSNCIAMTFMTGTRSALVALVIVASTFALLYRSKKFAIFLSAIALFVTLYTFLSDSHYIQNLLTRGGIGSWRPQIWHSSLLKSFENIWLGTGMWGDTSLIVNRDQAFVLMPHSHNFFLQILMWTGVVGFFLYVFVLSRALQLTFANLNRQFLGYAGVSLFYFVVVQLFDVYNIFTRPSYYWPCIWLQIGIIIGISSNFEKIEPKIDKLSF